jgi:dihydroflavonol-4-reductase
VIKALSFFDGDIAAILPLLGKPMLISNAKAARLLGIKFIPVQVTLRESAEYLIKNGYVKA